MANFLIGENSASQLFDELYQFFEQSQEVCFQIINRLEKD
jgi:hypothetical protein